MKTKLLAVIVALAGLGAIVVIQAQAGGVSVCELGISTGTNFVQCASASSCSGSGGVSVYGIEITSGSQSGSSNNPSDFAVCFDSSPTGGIANLGLNVFSDGKLSNSATRIVSAEVQTRKYDTGQILPRNAANGLACGKSVAGMLARVLYICN